MTKKDYQLIAETFAESIRFYSEWGGDDNERARARTAVLRTASKLAHALAKENPNFKVDVFLEACER